MRAPRSLFLLVILCACSPQETTGPGEIRWDKQVCDRCSMSIGDDRFAAQVRGGAEHQLYRFDDIGCAVIWLDQQPWKNNADTEIWISDYDSRRWIGARKAWFFRVLHSPMGYGLGARESQVEGAMNFNEAVLHIHTVENREHLHGEKHQHGVEPSG